MPGLLRVPFHRDEMLTSYISRTACANGRPDLHAFCHDLGLDLSGIMRGVAASISKLEKTLGSDPGELADRALIKTDTRNIRLGDMMFAAGSITPTARKYCPACLEADRQDRSRLAGTRTYARLQWSLSCIDACERHDVRLVPVQADVDSDWAFERISDLSSHTVVGHASLSVTTEDTIPAKSDIANPLKATAFEHFVAMRLLGERTHGPLLDAMALPAAIEAAHLFGLAKTVGKVFDWQNADIATLKKAATEGFHILSEGELGVQEALAGLAKSYSGNGSSGRAIYGTLFEIIARRPKRYDPLSEIIKRLISSAANGPRRHDPRRSMVSLQEISEKVAMTPRSVGRYLIQHGHLTTLPHNVADLEVSHHVAMTAVKALKDVASPEDIREVLGCSTAELRSMARSGLLNAVIGPIPDDARSGADRYSLLEMRSLRKELIALAKSRKPCHASLRDASTSSGKAAGDILLLLKARHFSNVSFDRTKSVFDGLRFDPVA